MSDSRCNKILLMRLRQERDRLAAMVGRLRRELKQAKGRRRFTSNQAANLLQGFPINQKRND